MQRLSRWRRWAIAAACAPLALLAGCPQQPARAPVPAKSTAPAIQPAAQAAVRGATTPTAREIADALARTQKAQQLIQRAEDAYRSGVANYGAGRLEAARSDFDAAVDMMLTSGMDLKTDAQLSGEFEHLLNAINTLEMSAA